MMQMPARGGASSAASAAGREGVRLRNNCLYVPGEGWVTWAAIGRQVERAYSEWRARKALEGVRVVDGWMWREGQVRAALTRRSKAAAAG